MRSAARQPKEEPGPERADLDAKAVRVLDEHLAASASVQALMARCPDPQSAALLRHALVLIADAGTHAEELRAQMRAYGQANESLEVAFQAGRDYERKLQDAQAAVPGPRHARGTARYRPGEGQRALFSVKTIPGIAVAALLGLKRIAGHGTGIKLTAHTLKVAAAATALPAAAVAITGAVVFSSPSGAHGAVSGQGPAPAASVEAARPVPSQSLAALTKPKHAARGKRLLASAVLPVPSSYVPASDPSSSSPPSSAAPVVSVAAGPAQLTVSAASLDLSNPLDPQVTFSITASGGGWASWRIGTAGVDLDFSQDHGVLQSGQVAWVTVSVAAGQAADGNTSQTFGVTVQGVTIQTVTVALPALVASVLPSPVVSASVIPSGL